MRDKRLERLDEAELLERGGAEIGQDAPVLALQLPDLGLDRARRGARGRLVADGLGQHGRACAQGEEMRSELVMQLVGDELALLVLGVENALHQFVIGAIQTVERLREAVDLGVEGADLRGPAILRARGIVAGFEPRKRRPSDSQGLDRAPDQEARHGDCRERHQPALERVLLRFLPDLVDLVRRVGDQDDRLGLSVLHRDGNDGCFDLRADKSAKPARRLGLPCWRR